MKHLEFVMPRGNFPKSGPAPGDAPNGQDLEREAAQRVYGLLSAYRSLLTVFGDVADGLPKVDWARLREARF